MGKLFTRRQVIKIWNKQSDEMLDTLTCPKCRDLLRFEGGYYFWEGGFEIKDTDVILEEIEDE